MSPERTHGHGECDPRALCCRSTNTQPGKLLSCGTDAKQRRLADERKLHARHQGCSFIYNIVNII